MNGQTQRDNPTPSETARVESALRRMGAAWRASAGREFPPTARERTLEALLESRIEEREALPRAGGRGPLAWLRYALRPLSYGLAGAALALLWLLWARPADTAIHAVFAPAASGAAAGQRPGALARGEVIRAEAEPGVALEIENGGLVLLRPGTEVAACGLRRLELRAGEIWVYHEGPARGIQIETPFGEVAPVGTVFGVSVSATSLETLVEQGQVEVKYRGGGAALLAGAGQRLRGASEAVAQIETASATSPAWTKPLLEAYRTAFFSRYFPSATSGGGRE